MNAIRSCVLQLMLSTAVAGSTSAQVQLDWMTTLAGPVGDSAEGIRRGVADAAGNSYLLMTSSVGSSIHTEIVKLSPDGARLWTQRIAGFMAFDLAISPGGELLLCGSGAGLVLLGYDLDGNRLWEHVQAGASGRAIAFDAQGNTVVAGSADEDMLVQAYSPTGTLLWDTRIDGPAHLSDGAACVLVDAAGDVFVAGSVGSPQASSDAAVAKLTSAGQLSWLSTWSATAQSEGFGSIASDGQGGVIVGGRVDFTWWPHGNFSNAHVARCDANGVFLWHHLPYGVAAYDAVIDLLVDRSEAIWVLIQDEIFSFSDPSIVVRRLALDGSLLSELIYDGPTQEGAVPGGMLLGSAGQVFVSGSLGDNFGSVADRAVVMQLDADGAVSWTQLVPGTGFGAQANGGMCAAGDARLVVFGSAFYAGFLYDGLALQLDVGESPQGYCRAKVNSLGCTPVLAFTGISSAAAGSGFVVRAEQLVNDTPGLFLHGLQGRASLPFGGGTLCLAGQVLRTPALVSGGTPGSAQDCSGVLAIDWNAFARGHLGGHPAPALLVPGSSVHVQAWARDPGYPAPENLSLSSGLRYVVLP